jgi:tetratricopeptide (TPR) repeat protein
MTSSASNMSSEPNRREFVSRRLPWIVGAGALIVFLVTLNQWLNLRNVGYVARVAGWEMELPVQWPLFFTLTFPFRFLPAGIQPMALNLFAVICATLTVVLLARSVALLPHDRTHDQRIRERSEFSLLTIRWAWVPVVLACGALAFQLTFWENATSLTNEMVDLLAFAYVIRCLLEYRISQDDNWLAKMAFVYGLAVTSNWAMIGFFPLFLGAVIWIKGVRFFDPGFLVRTVVCGLAGLLLYFLLPIVWVIKGEGHTFWEVLQTNLLAQKLFLIDQKAFRNRALLLGLTSVLPVILMGIRWRTHEGDTNAAASALTNLAFRVIHLFFLVACVWIAFDPKYSPRTLGMSLSYLTFYYLGALVIGYYSGYALLVFTEAPRRGRVRDGAVGKLINPLVRGALVAAVVLVPAGLIYKNFGRVRSENGAILKSFANRVAGNLPAGPAYLLSDDPYALSMIEGHHSAEGKRSDYVYVSTAYLEQPGYHAKLRKRYGERWRFGGEEEEESLQKIPQPEIQAMVRSLATSNVVAYLHPSFGYFFEAVYPVPNGEVQRLQAFARAEYLPPKLGAEQIESNQKYWGESGGYFDRVQRLKERRSMDALWVSRYYSRALNTWGVELLRNERAAEAGPHLDRAMNLNTNNVPAEVNAEWVKQTQAGKTVEPLSGKALEERFGEYRSWDRIVSENGPFDHPDFCQPFALNLLNQNQYRQAALQFSRVIKYRPRDLVSRLGLVQSLIGGYWVDEAMAELERMEREFPNLSDADKVEVARMRAAGQFAKGEFAKAETTLKEAKQAMPQHSALAESLFELYRQTGNFTNALAVINEQLRQTPTNTVIHLQKAELLLSVREFDRAHDTLNEVMTLAPKNVPGQLLQAFAYIQEKEYEKAITVLDRLLRENSDNQQALLYKGIAHFEKGDMEAARRSFDTILNASPDHQLALRNRAVLHLRAKRWGEAKEDYERLRKLAPRSHSVMYGLGEVAAEEGRRADAIRFFEAYLKYAPKDGGPELEAEKKGVQERIEQLRAPGQ